MFRKLIIFPIKVYKKVLSPLIPGSCRFYPTCSDYAKEAIEHYGVVKGLFLAAKRLLKCHQLHPGGYDPVSKENYL
jgi:uncharacterized protein